MNLIEFDGKCYALDFNKLVNIVFKQRQSDGSKDKTKVETWGLTTNEKGDEDFRVLQKEVSETSSETNENYASFRYDLVKNLLNLILSPIADGEGNVLRINTLEDMYFGQMIAFNTLVNEGIIIEINED